jgi:hypothetical protein
VGRCSREAWLCFQPQRDSFGRSRHLERRSLLPRYRAGATLPQSRTDQDFKPPRHNDPRAFRLDSAPIPYSSGVPELMPSERQPATGNRPIPTNFPTLRRPRNPFERRCVTCSHQSCCSCCCSRWPCFFLVARQKKRLKSPRSACVVDRAGFRNTAFRDGV